MALDNLEQEYLDEMLNNISEDIDKRVGSVSYTILAAVAKLAAELKDMNDYTFNQISPLTADREMLEKKCEAIGITPLPATNAVLKAEIIMNEENGVCPLGSRFNNTDLNFIVIDYKGDNIYSLQCEQAGVIGNEAFGRILPIYNIPGFQQGNIIGLEVAGTDVEDDDSLRQRFIDNFTSRAYGGNVQDYLNRLHAIPQVGGVKLYRLFQGNELWVGIFFTNSLFEKPTQEEIEIVQEQVHPILESYAQPIVENSGDGFAPIGHVAFVNSVQTEIINIKLNIDLNSRYEYGEVEEEIQEAVKKYIENENKRWEEEESLVMRVSRIENAILGIDGIEDVYDTEINGVDKNYTLDKNAIAVLGEIEVSEE